MTYDRAVTMTITVKTLKPGETFTRQRDRRTPSQALDVSDNAADAGVLRTFADASGAAVTSFTVAEAVPVQRLAVQLLHRQLRATRARSRPAAPTPPTSRRSTRPRRCIGDPDASSSRSRRRSSSPRSTSACCKDYATAPPDHASTQDQRLRDADQAGRRRPTPALGLRGVQQLALKDWPTATYGAACPTGATRLENFVVSGQHGLRRRACRSAPTRSASWTRRNTATSYVPPTTYDNTAPSGRRAARRRAIAAPAPVSWSGRAVMLSRACSSEDGFTLPELLVTIVIAMIMSLATFSLVEIVMRRSGEIARARRHRPARPHGDGPDHARSCARRSARGAATHAGDGRRRARSSPPRRTLGRRLRRLQPTRRRSRGVVPPPDAAHAHASRPARSIGDRSSQGHVRPAAASSVHVRRRRRRRRARC